MEHELLVCVVEYPGVKLLCIGRGGEGISNTSHYKENSTHILIYWSKIAFGSILERGVVFQVM